MMAGQDVAAPESRDVTIDVLRGLAIVTMIPANMAGTVYAEPHAFWFRAFTSFAAPLFVLLSGYLVAINTQTKGYGLKYYLRRGAMLLIAAALIDLLVWRVVPCMTFDVLYLIGLSLPGVYLFRRISRRRWRWVVMAALLGGAPILRAVLGYADYPTEVYWIPAEQVELPANKSNPLQNFLIDGWFPIFPWLAFSFVGSMLADVRQRRSDGLLALDHWSQGIGLVVLLVGLGVWWYYPGPMLVREGYSELFYPPTVGYVLTALGLIVLLFAAVDRRPDLRFFQPLRILGEAALSMYILHLVLISYVLKIVLPDQPPGIFLVAAVLLILVCLAAGIAVRKLKRTWPHQPMPVRFLLGT